MKKYIQIDGKISTIDTLDLFMDLLFRANKEFYRKNPKAKRVIDVCRFKPESDPDVERFITAEMMLLKGTIAKSLGLNENDEAYPEFDCEDFTCAEAAYLVEILGIDAKPTKFKSPYVNKLHAVVMLPDGKLYDPSLLAGMKEH